ncbi:MAG: hypothetical protein J6T51_01110 [Kiritimatiellae bacterium]|nr:hypothetical protein [Kiritimatiellia bacterium]
MFERRAYLLDVTDRRPNLRTMQELVDVLARFGYNEFFLMDAAEREAPPDTAREASYCGMQGIDFRAVGRDELREMETDPSNVLAPTFAARSLCGRIEEMRLAMERAEEAGRLRKARRFLVTDLSDGHAWHPLCVSFPGIALGGNLMTAGRSAAKADLEKDLCSVMDLPVGGLLQRLGTLYLRGGALRPDASEYFNILAGDAGYSRHPGITQYVLDDVSAVARGVRIAAERWAERNDWAKEIVYAANLLDCACHRRDEGRLRALRDEHGHVWRRRFEPEGRVESLSLLPRF